MSNCVYNYLNASVRRCQAAEQKERRCPYAEKRTLYHQNACRCRPFERAGVRIQLDADRGGPGAVPSGQWVLRAGGASVRPADGGLAAGFGSMLFDFTNPAYISGCLITFATKFVIGYLAGLIAHRGTVSTRKDILGTLAGSAAYIVLYMAKSFVEMYWIEGQAMGAVQARMAAKLSASCVNAAVALVVATLLAAALRPALRRAKVLAQ